MPAARGPLGCVNPFAHMRTVGKGLPSHSAKSAVVSLPRLAHFFKRAANPPASGAERSVECGVEVSIDWFSVCNAEVLRLRRCAVASVRLWWLRCSTRLLGLWRLVHGLRRRLARRPRLAGRAAARGQGARVRRGCSHSSRWR